MFTCLAVAYVPAFLVILIILFAIGAVFAIIINVYKSKQSKRKLGKIQDVHTSTQQIIRLVQPKVKKDIDNGRKQQDSKEHTKS